MDKQLRTLVNDIIQENYLALFKFEAGFVYWVRNHWKYLDPRVAPSVRLGRASPPLLHYWKDDGTVKFLYRTEVI